MGYAVITKGNVRFWTKVTIFFLDQSNYFLKILVWNLGGNVKNAGNQGGDVENQGRNLGIAVEMK